MLTLGSTYGACTLCTEVQYVGSRHKNAVFFYTSNPSIHSHFLTRMELLALRLPSSLLPSSSSPDLTYLTGQVTKTESYCFDHGGSADIWKGRWAYRDSEYVEVQTYLARWPFLFVCSILVLAGSSQSPQRTWGFRQIHRMTLSTFYNPVSYIFCLQSEAPQGNQCLVQGPQRECHTILWSLLRLWPTFRTMSCLSILPEWQHYKLP
jgi:hypothetical protein